jgi:hypothetical protein
MTEVMLPMIPPPMIEIVEDAGASLESVDETGTLSLLLRVAEGEEEGEGRA